MERGKAHLPNEVWCFVLEYLDAESLLAVETSRVLSWSVFAERRLRRRVTLSPHSDAAKLKDFIAWLPLDDVRVLHLTNCIMACPVKLLESISVCRLLTELYCVNCRLSLRGLFRVIVESLPVLARFEYSIYDVNDDDRAVDFMARGDVVIANLRCMHVEVMASERSYALLASVLRSCPRLEELSVQVRGQHKLMQIDVFFEAISCWRQVRVFTYTIREPNVRVMSLLYAMRWLQHLPSSENPLRAMLFGSVTYWLRPTSFSNCLYLTEVMAVPEVSHRNLQQATLGVEMDAAAPVALAQAAHLPLWRRLEALAIAVVPAHVMWCGASPYFGTAYRLPLRDLLSACSVLTELNVSSIHFTAEVDFCQILAAAEIVHLRALSLTPCAARAPASVLQLAASFARLQELDVRAFREMCTHFCAICRSPFEAINEATMQVLHQHTRLQSLENCTSFEAQISAQCDALAEALEARRRELLAFARREREAKLKALKGQLSNCTVTLQRTTALLQFCIEALKETDHAAFLQASI
ncbi:hypothetical protein HPB48_025095 [Haemaphysalis longicornis]|uniref:F-box domain-containing protein n=1 Tax=Haemaphysalis longicornis TaxID=44386 RepID=A0A9J6H777_HAELO|nr:hypothetical protein HPB48_025095 [Haemaphysalis longicornis]